MSGPISGSHKTTEREICQNKRHKDKAVAAREAANRINPDNSLTDQVRAVEEGVAAASRNSRIVPINLDRNRKIDQAADKPSA